MVKGMNFSQSIEAPLTLSDTAFLTGNYSQFVDSGANVLPMFMLIGQLSTHKGSGSGSVNVSLRRITSPDGWAELEMGFGSGLSLSAKGFRNLTKRIFTNVSGIVTSTDRGLVLGFVSSEFLDLWLVIFGRF